MVGMRVRNFNISVIMIFIIFALSACITTQEKNEPGVTEGPSGADVSTANSEISAATVETDANKADSGVAVKEEAKIEVKTGSEKPPEVTSFVKEEAGIQSEEEVEEKAVVPLRIVESCKNEPYVKYEKQAMTSLEKGLAATKAGKFGVGFRKVDDYKRWKGIHEKLFKTVNESCNALKKCAGKNAKDKETKCAVEAYVFNEWQKKAEHFTIMAKAAETTEPDPICSVEPNLADDPKCFHGLADNFDKFCSAPECKEVSDCWRGVGFLDQAITQARQACGFVHQELSTCRGYLEATKRREDKFNRCMDMQKKINMPLFPEI